MIAVTEHDVLQGLARRARMAFQERGERGVLIANGGRLIYNTLSGGHDGSEQAARIRALLASYDPACEAVLHFLVRGTPTTRLIPIADLH